MKPNQVAGVDEEPVGTSVSSTDVVVGAAVVVVVRAAMSTLMLAASFWLMYPPLKSKPIPRKNVNRLRFGSSRNGIVQKVLLIDEQLIPEFDAKETV